MAAQRMNRPAPGRVFELESMGRGHNTGCDLTGIRFGLPAPRLGVGDAADFVLVAPDARWPVEAATLHGKSYNSPVLGRSLPGRIDLTLCQGQVGFDRTALEPRS